MVIIITMNSLKQGNSYHSLERTKRVRSDTLETIGEYTLDDVCQESPHNMTTNNKSSLQSLIAQTVQL